jgi:hypothetical protein
VHELVDDVDPEAVTHEYAAALKDYCMTFASLTEHVRSGQDLSLDQMDEIDAAKLRLENARTLCELYVCRGLEQAPQLSSPSP